MKKLYLLTALPALLFSFDINFNKKFSKTLTQDTLTTNLSIIVNDTNEKQINKTLEKFNKKIKSYDKVKKSFGTLNIRPNYKTSNNIPEIIGYRGELKYKVSSTKSSNIDEFIKRLLNLKKDRNTNIVINNLSWTVTEDQYIKVQEDLRLTSIQWLNNYAKELSKTLNKNCEIKNINIHTNSYRPLLKMAYNSESLNTNIAVPESNEEEISITPSFTLECK